MIGDLHNTFIIPSCSYRKISSMLLDNSDRITIYIYFNISQKKYTYISSLSSTYPDERTYGQTEALFEKYRVVSDITVILGGKLKLNPNNRMLGQLSFILSHVCTNGWTYSFKDSIFFKATMQYINKYSRMGTFMHLTYITLSGNSCRVIYLL